MADPDLLPAAAFAAGLRANDWCLQADALSPALTAALHAEAAAHAAAGRLRAAATGRGDDRQHAGLRTDATLWLDDAGAGPAAMRLLAALEQLRADLNRELLLGVHDVEAHFAHYPPGGGYARHRDRFRSDDARVLSLVAYLNPHWPADAGGELRLHLPAGTIDIAPRGGSVVMFLSEVVEHEVLAATRDRFSVAAWFRRPR